MIGVEIVRTGDEIRLVFAPALDIVGARDLYDKLNGVLATTTTLVLDAGRVERVDTAALQLLAAFCHAMREAGSAVQWYAASPALCDAIALLGLNETLGRPK